jgi:hypothetical protein
LSRIPENEIISEPLDDIKGTGGDEKKDKRDNDNDTNDIDQTATDNLAEAKPLMVEPLSEGACGLRDSG